MISALDAVSTSVKQSTGTLRVGVTITTDRPSVDRLLARFRREHPECHLSVEEIGIWEPYNALRDGEIDVLCNWLAVEEPDLTPGPVIEQCSRVLVVGADHPLAQRASVTSEELAGERLNRPPKRYPQALADAILVPRTLLGRPIARTDEELESVPEVVAMIARGEVVSISFSDNSRYARPDIVLVPVTDLPALPLGLIWCTAHENARIRALAKVASSMEARDSASAQAATPGEGADELT
jgi:DNA-binding transcriptional LysR family regulator